MKVMLTGGAGYVGSHTAVELVNGGHEIVIVDNLSNSKRSVIDHLQKICGRPIRFHELDVQDTDRLTSLCEEEQIDAIIHFAGLKAVGESVADPLKYYRVNLMTAISVCEAMLACGIKHLVFSSSATVYGEPERIPLDEACDASHAANPYGTTKIMIEQILRDLAATHPHLNIALLRYFNPAGAHPSGMIGEDPQGIPNNLIPFLTQVAVGMHEKLTINGDDYPTPDGTCIRDYIHVTDLALGHLAALDKLETSPGLVTYNLGSGTGHSVKEVVAAFESETGVVLSRTLGPRRAGDVPVSYTDPSLARHELSWSTQKSIRDICRDAWRWQQNYPEGFPD